MAQWKQRNNRMFTSFEFGDRNAVHLSVEDTADGGHTWFVQASGIRELHTRRGICYTGKADAIRACLAEANKVIDNELVDTATFVDGMRNVRLALPSLQPDVEA